MSQASGISVTSVTFSSIFRQSNPNPKKPKLKLFKIFMHLHKTRTKALRTTKAHGKSKKTPIWSPKRGENSSTAFTATKCRKVHLPFGITNLTPLSRPKYLLNVHQLLQKRMEKGHRVHHLNELFHGTGWEEKVGDVGVGLGEGQEDVEGLGHLGGREELVEERGDLD